MPNNVDAVIAALRIAQEEAEKNADDDDYWDVMTANRSDCVPVSLQIGNRSPDMADKLFELHFACVIAIRGILE